MKKIAFYIGNLNKGGAQRVVTNLANYFNKEGYEVLLVTFDRNEIEFPYDEGIKRILSNLTDEELSTSKGKLIPRIQNFKRRIRKLRSIWEKEQPDIIVSFLKKNNYYAIWSTRGLDIPVVLSVRSDPNREYPGKLDTFLAKHLFQKADGVVLQTEDAYRYFPKKVQEHSVIIQNSLNPKFIRERYEGVRRDEIVAVGTIDDNKNHAMLIDAFVPVHARYPQMKLIIYGDGCKRKALEEKVQDMGLAEAVLFPGRSDTIYEQIYESRIFVLPSKVEGMPNALIEAMTLGLAVVSTDCPCGGPRMLIKDGINGLLVPVDDQEAMTNAILKILDNPELEESMGREAHKLLDEVHPDKVNKIWETYLCKLAK